MSGADIGVVIPGGTNRHYRQPCRYYPPLFTDIRCYALRSTAIGGAAPAFKICSIETGCDAAAFAMHCYAPILGHALCSPDLGYAPILGHALCSTDLGYAAPFCYAMRCTARHTVGHALAAHASSPGWFLHSACCVRLLCHVQH
eukprot:267176-Rhodomonas_salina.2